MPIPVGIAAAGISALGGLLANGLNGNYNAEQAQLNRDFQERMYNRQYKDSIDFWRMNNAYNSPAAVLGRLRDAGINPLLALSNGGAIGTSQSAPNQPNQPSGSTAHASFVNPFETAQYLLIDAEREKKEAETEKIKSETDWQNLENRFSRDTYDIRYAIQHHNDEMLMVSMDKMRNEIANSSLITSQQLQTMMQARQYEVKRFNLDFDTYGTQLEQGWQHLKYEGQNAQSNWLNARANYKSACATMLRAQTELNISKWQIGAIAQDILFNSKANPLKLQRFSLENELLKWDSHLKKAKLNEFQLKNFHQRIENFYYQRYGTDKPFNSGSSWTNSIKDAANMLDASFIVPLQR